MRGTHRLMGQRGGQVRTAEETEWMRSTHLLESAEGGTSQDSKRKLLDEGHSPTGERKERDKSELQKKASERASHTS